MRMPNRLAGEASPYLLQHARNPVDWYPWGDEALARAAREDRPILLSVGYSACHWCHVMERESFEDPAIAARMNASFVCVKVDREERPDIDHVYQTVVQLMGRSGGWPLTVVLTPDRRPFFGGTYFPPEPRHGLPGFPTVLDAVAEAFREKRGEIDAQAGEMADAIREVLARPHPPVEAREASAPADLLEHAVEKLTLRFDDACAGFGRRPKFPNTLPLALLLRRGALDGDEAAAGRVRRALDAMRRGGVHDQLGGGFHRYSTDAEWLVPHFEKMLYDNALLLRSYVDGFRALGVAAFAQVAREIDVWAGREMTSAGGAFFASQDADSEGEEGRFFVWGPADLEGIGPDDRIREAARLAWGITERGNFEDTGKTVLSVARTEAEVANTLGVPEDEVGAALARAREVMLRVRDGRPKPFRDEKILTSWNALYLGALAEAARPLGCPAMLDRARRAFSFVWDRLVDEETCTVHRLVKEGHAGAPRPGFLDDYAFLTDAAIDLYEVTGDPAYLSRARRVADEMVRRFFTEGVGFYFTEHHGEPLVVRAMDAHDGAIPSGTSVAIRACLRLGARFEGRLEQIGHAASMALLSRAAENPLAFAGTIAELDTLVRGRVDVVLVGAREDARTQALADTVFARYLPHRNLVWLDPGDEASREACGVLAEGKVAGAEPVAYVCSGQTCSLPLSNLDDWAAGQLASLGSARGAVAPNILP